MLNKIRAMLNIGKECGLNKTSEAYSAMMLHWDAFFTYEAYQQESREFHDEMKRIGLLTEQEDGYFTFSNRTIDEALEIVENESLRSLQK
jgi:hypothetical protein